MRRAIQHEDTQTVYGRVQGQVALEAIRDERTISELATKHQLHPNQITKWKGRPLRSWPKVFDDKAADAQVSREAEVAKQHAKIGQLVVERDFFGESLRSLSLDRRRIMIDPDHPRLSIRRQCELVSISRASFYRQPAGESPENLELMRIIDRVLHGRPLDGSRQMARHLTSGMVRRPQAGAAAHAQDRAVADLPGAEDQRTAPAAPHLSLPAATPEHRAAGPGLVRRRDLHPMRRGYLYLIAIMDWFSRKVLA